jgi:hypothetical protein
VSTKTSMAGAQETKPWQLHPEYGGHLHMNSVISILIAEMNSYIQRKAGA